MEQAWCKGKLKSRFIDRWVGPLLTTIPVVSWFPVAEMKILNVSEEEENSSFVNELGKHSCDKRLLLPMNGWNVCGKTWYCEEIFGSCKGRQEENYKSAWKGRGER